MVWRHHFIEIWSKLSMFSIIISNSESYSFVVLFIETQSHILYFCIHLWHFHVLKFTVPQVSVVKTETYFFSLSFHFIIQCDSPEETYQWEFLVRFKQVFKRYIQGCLKPLGIGTAGYRFKFQWGIPYHYLPQAGLTSIRFSRARSARIHAHRP